MTIWSYCSCMYDENSMEVIVHSVPFLNVECHMHKPLLESNCYWLIAPVQWNGWLGDAHWMTQRYAIIMMVSTGNRLVKSNIMDVRIGSPSRRAAKLKSHVTNYSPHDSFEFFLIFQCDCDITVIVMWLGTTIVSILGHDISLIFCDKHFWRYGRRLSVTEMETTPQPSPVEKFWKK